MTIQTRRGRQTTAFGGSYQNPTGAITDYTAFGRGLAAGITPGVKFLKEQETERKEQEAEEKLRREKEMLERKTGAASINTSYANYAVEAASAGSNLNKKLSGYAQGTRDFYLSDNATLDDRKFFDSSFAVMNKSSINKLGLILGSYGDKNSDFEAFENNVSLGTYKDKDGNISRVNHTDFIKALSSGEFEYTDNKKYNANEYKTFISYKTKDGSTVTVDLSKIKEEDIIGNLAFKSDSNDLIKGSAGKALKLANNFVTKKQSYTPEQLSVAAGIQVDVLNYITEAKDPENNFYNHAVRDAINKTKITKGQFANFNFNGVDLLKPDKFNKDNLIKNIMSANADISFRDAEEYAEEELERVKDGFLENYLTEQALISSGGVFYKNEAEGDYTLMSALQPRKTTTRPPRTIKDPAKDLFNIIENNKTSEKNIVSSMFSGRKFNLTGIKVGDQLAGTFTTSFDGFNKKIEPSTNPNSKAKRITFTGKIGEEEQSFTYDFGYIKSGDAEEGVFTTQDYMNQYLPKGEDNRTIEVLGIDKPSVSNIMTGKQASIMMNTYPRLTYKAGENKGKQETDEEYEKRLKEIFQNTMANQGKGGTQELYNQLTQN